MDAMWAGRYLTSCVRVTPARRTGLVFAVRLSRQILANPLLPTACHLGNADPLPTNGGPESAGHAQQSARTWPEVCDIDRLTSFRYAAGI